MDVVSGYQPAPLTQEERAELHNVILLATLPMEEPQTDVESLSAPPCGWASWGYSPLFRRNT